MTTLEAGPTHASLALNGGRPVRDVPLPSVSSLGGRRLGADELNALTSVLRSGQLNRTVADESFVGSLEDGFASWSGRRHCIATSSGTAALHVAVAAVNPDPGDEIIVPPVSDMGTVIPVLAQNAVPVFADVDPETWCIDPEAVRSALTPRTRAIIVVHLFGQACDMDALSAIARENDVALIEDCAQAFGARWRGRRVGQFGDIGCFSLQQSKHITTGDGGLTVTDDPDIARRMRLFSDKAWPRATGLREHLFLGLNYRMTELAGAVGCAQLGRLDSVVEDRRRIGESVGRILANLPGVTVPTTVSDASTSSFWTLHLNVDPMALAGVGLAWVAAAITAEGVPCSAGYVRPLYLHPVLADGKTFGRSHFPFGSAYTDRTFEAYREGMCPVAEEMPNRTLLLPVNENFTDDDIRDICDAVEKVLSVTALSSATRPAASSTSVGDPAASTK